MPLFLMSPIDRELPPERDRHRIGLVALVGLGQKFTLRSARRSGDVTRINPVPASQITLVREIPEA